MIMCLRYDSGDYSCRGSNEAGYGAASPGVSLAVQCECQHMSAPAQTLSVGRDIGVM